MQKGVPKGLPCFIKKCLRVISFTEKATYDSNHATVTLTWNLELSGVEPESILSLLLPLFTTIVNLVLAPKIHKTEQASSNVGRMADASQSTQADKYDTVRSLSALGNDGVDF